MLFDTEIKSDEPPSPLRPGKDEMNFAEFPIALLTDRAPRGQNVLRFEDQIFDARRKRHIPRRRVIEGSEEYGLPTATDDAVILALIQLTKIKGDFTRREVEFTRLELIKMLGWADEGRSFDRIKLSLLRIANVTYNYDNAWWDGRQRAWTTKVFHILDTVEINDSRAGGGQCGLFPSRIVWNEVVFDSFQAGFLRNIDFDLCMRLEHPTALRMYRFLGKRFHQKPHWRFDLKEFAHDHIGLGRSYEGGTQLARKLTPAIQELERADFLEPMARSERFSKKGRHWTVQFVQKGNPPAVADGGQLPLSFEHPPCPLIGELVARGVTRATADELVAGHPSERIEAHLDVFDWMRERDDRRVARSPAGYLVTSIRKDFANPKGFKTKAEREEARRKVEAKADREVRQKAEQERAEAEKLRREEAEQARLDAYWDGLSAGDQAALDEASKASDDPDIALWAKMERNTKKTREIRQTYQRFRRHSYIRKLLTEQEELA